MTIQLEPVQMPGAQGLDETEEERRARLAAEAAAAQVAANIEPIVPPAPLPDLGPNPAAPPESADAQRVGDAYRANADRGLAATETTHPVVDRATSRAMPPARVLRFDDPSSPPPAAPSPSIQPRAAAPSPGAGRRLGAPGEQAAAPAVPPVIARRRALEAQIRARQAQQASAQPPARQPVDHTGADVADAFRRPLHAIANALRGAGGQQGTAFRSMGDESRARERESIEQATARRQQESRMRLAERREQRADATLEATQADRDARREDASARTQSLDDYRREMARIRQQVADGQISRSRATADSIRLRTEREQALRDPGSELSASARNEYAQWRNGLPERLRSALGMVDTSEMTADQIQRMQAAHVRAIGTRRDVGRRSGGGGGGARPAAERPPGYSESDWRQMTRSQRGAAVSRAAQQRAEGGAAAGESIVPGLVVTNNAAAESLNVSQVGQLRDEVVDYRNTQRLIDRFETLLGEASVLERAGNLIGTSPVMRQLENTQRQLALGQRSILGPGAITDQEREVLMQLVPSVDLIRSSATARRQLRDMRTSRQSRFNDYLDTRGFRADPNYRVGGGRPRGGSQQQRQAPAASASRVRLYRPDGRELWVSADQVDTALSHGASRERP